ncbi:hypothetical protein [Gracilimonas halophila]|uniref:Uncharacterized protein n=1 Tax=Gracilimonas halophila TaxID=1834464 RepID=A0ABW5JLN5_9BACT
MNNKNNKFTELCTGHVLKALSENEEREFQQLLAQANEEQLLLYYELKAAASELATQHPGETPSPSVKN